MIRMKNLTCSTLVFSIFAALLCGLPALAQSDETASQKVYTNADLPAKPEPPKADEPPEPAAPATAAAPATPPGPAAPPAPASLATPSGRIFTNDDLPARPPQPDGPEQAPPPPPAPVSPGVRIFTNDDLPAAPPAPPAPPEEDEEEGMEIEPAEPESDAVEETAALTECDRMYAGETDRNGHDCAWWRDRVRDLFDAREAADEELRMAEERLAELQRAPRYVRHLGSAVFVADRERLETAQAEVDRLAAEREELFEEARRAGALPGWLREAKRP